MQPLLDSQQKALDKLSSLKVGALFMDAGTGKTRAALDLVRSARPDYVLWLTPCATIQNLKDEIELQGGLECKVAGIESLSLSDRLYLELMADLRKAKSAFVICDESLKIKNSDAIRTKRILELGKMSSYRLVLNGTPLSRNLLDLWSQMEFLSPRILNMREAEFKNTFVEYVRVTHHHPGGSTYSREFIRKYHNLPYLYSLIEPYVFESTLSISVGIQHHDMRYSLTEKEILEHNFLKEKYLDNDMLLFRRNNIFLELTQKMQHNYSLSPEKFSITDEIIRDVDPTKVLIYAKYVDTQIELRKRYPQIAIKSLGKHSYGLNLQEYNHTIFWDKTWDYAQREQVERRTYRTGQANDCYYYDLTSNAGLDKLINENIKKKSSMLEMFKKMSLNELKENI